MKENNQKIEWFWAHRRTASLHHTSFLMHGMRGKGWSPAVDFWFDNQAIVGVPKKGVYVFYDKNQLKSGAKYKDIQDSIDRNQNFVRDFRRRSDEIFGSIFSRCKDIDDANLPSLSISDLKILYEGFISAIMACPFISVQLWGIEACFDEKYKIISFLRKRLEELGKSRDFEVYKGLLSVNIGETVAFTERKDFYTVALQLSKDAKSGKDPFRNPAFDEHIKKYEWVNTEYTGDSWSREKWMNLFNKTLGDIQSPEVRLKELMQSFAGLNAQRQKAIEELNPPKEVLHALNALAELIAQRDWSKGYFTKALLSYHRLLDEVAKRINVTREEIFLYSYVELDRFFGDGSLIEKTEIDSRRKDGFVILIKNGLFELVTGKDNIARTIDDEGISEPFEKVINMTEFKGLAASRGKIKGKARVLEDASKISELKEGEILVTYMTTIEFIPAFRKAAAVVTDEGGMSCHAAIISREFKLPCIVGTKVATRVVKTGDELEVDAIRGTVKIL